MTEGERVANSAAWWQEPHPREPSLDILAELIDAALLAAQAEIERLQIEKDGVIKTALHYETTLRSIASNTCCDGCQEAALVAKTALEF